MEGKDEGLHTKTAAKSEVCLFQEPGIKNGDPRLEYLCRTIEDIDQTIADKDREIVYTRFRVENDIYVSCNRYHGEWYVHLRRQY